MHTFSTSLTLIIVLHRSYSLDEEHRISDYQYCGWHALPKNEKRYLNDIELLSIYYTRHSIMSISRKYYRI